MKIKSNSRKLSLIFLIFQRVIHTLSEELNKEIRETPFDFIVVGAGSAGSVIASRLTEIASVNVLLIEAGGRPPLESNIPATSLLNTNYDWKFKTTPQVNACLGFNNQQCDYTRGKALGGSSTINYMAYSRGNCKDYDHWATLGNKGWSCKDVLPYFLKSEGNTIRRLKNDTIYHNSNGSLTISTAPYKTEALNLFLNGGEEMGYNVTDTNGPFPAGFTHIPLTMRDGARCSTYKAFLAPALKRKNLKVVTHCLALKVLFDNHKQAVGVSFSCNGTLYNASVTKDVILSAGSIQSPQILMLSGIGPAEHLKQFKIPVVVNLPGVGNNLHDHVGSKALSWSTNSFRTITSADLESKSNLKEWLYSRKGPLTVPFQVEGAANVFSSMESENEAWPDVQLFLISSRNPFINQTAPSNGSFIFFPVVLHPKSTGSIRLQSSDPHVSPLIDPQYLSHSHDVKVLLKATKLLFKLTNTSVFLKHNVTFDAKPVSGCESHIPFTDEYLTCAFRQLTFAGLHAVGTCKMGPSNDSMAVVDPEGLRVHKVKGLRVVDASIMPYIVSGPTNAPSIMIAEKLSVAILKQWEIV